MRLIIGLAALLALLPALSAQAGDVGHVLRIQGQVTAATASATSHPLAVGDRIAEGERLSTGPGARLMAEFDDGSELTLGEKTDFTIDELVLQSGHANALFRLGGGAFRLVGGAIARQPDHRMEVATAFGTIGIRGTDVWGGAIEHPLDVFLLEGEVSISTPQGTVILNQPGQGTSVTASGLAPLPAHNWSQDLRQRAFATISFAP